MGEVAWWHTYENFRACRLEGVRLQLPGFPDEDWPEIDKKVVKTPVYQCTVFRKAYILSGSGFHEFLYSIIESLKKNREIAEFIPNQLRFHEKKL